MTIWTYDCDHCNHSEKSEYPDIEGHLKNVHGITDYEEIKWARSLLEKDPESVDPYEEEMLPFYGEI
jgi:hypothetical protein